MRKVLDDVTDVPPSAVQHDLQHSTATSTATAVGQDLPDQRRVRHDQRQVHYDTDSASRVPYEENASKRFRSSSDFVRIPSSRYESHGPTSHPPSDI